MFEKSSKFTGMRNGKLVAIKNVGPIRRESGRIESRWLFKCDCGNEKIMCPYHVFKIRPNKPNVKGALSCGCDTKRLMREAKSRPDGEAALTGLYAGYKLSCAKHRGYVFELSIEEFRTITKQNCYYCGKEPSQKKKSKSSFYIYNGVDRVNNSKGYTIDNCVASCGECNSLKSGVSVSIAIKMLEFLGVINDKT